MLKLYNDNLIFIKFSKLTFFVYVFNRLFLKQQVFSLDHYNYSFSLFDFFYMYVLRVLSRFGFCNFALLLSKKKSFF